MPPTTIEQQLQALHAHYTSRVNAALAAGRMDLAQELAADCRDEALDLMLGEDAGSAPPGEVEVLELGGELPQWPRGRPRSPRRRFWRPASDR